ncbi:MAG: hypothetical protein AB7N24_11970 [Dehalococcoidia bacterium]
MNNTLAKVYAGIVAIPLAAVMIAGLAAGGGSTEYSGYQGDSASIRPASVSSANGTRLNEAEAYSSLGRYNPCIFIACDGE